MPEPPSPLPPAQPLEVEVSRVGPYCLLRISGRIHRVIMPMKIGQTRRVIKEMQQVVEQIEGMKLGGPRRKRKR